MTVSETEEVTTTETATAKSAKGTTASAKGARATKTTGVTKDSGKDSDAR
ncbi:Uncharacterised protein [Mycobacteroides abscessus subsp. abscessus]|nr:Uncharacterised protein [Mycobacteroides abscessus subsp. abscessus]